jgi:predicted nucleic acid-binding protein
MRAVFADTFYFLALLNRRDPFHQSAVASSRIESLRIVTTEFVLLEVADALCQPSQRSEVAAIWHVVELKSGDYFRGNPAYDWYFAPKQPASCIYSRQK